MPKVMRKTTRAKLNQKIKKYKSLNKKYNKYETSFDLAHYNANDIPVVGDKQEKKRLSKRNYRQRMKLLGKLLDKRIHTMENLDIGMAGEIVLAEFEPLITFPEEETPSVCIFEDFYIPYPNGSK